jgi:hypothetical protein
MKLFDDVERWDDRPAGFADTHFPYLNQSSRMEAERIRSFLEEAFDRYPERGKTDLRNRFRKNDDVPHYGALFELVVHELLRRAACSVEVHPSTGKKSTRPDFLVTCPYHGQFYLEATVVMPRHRGTSGERRIARVLYHQLNSTLWPRAPDSSTNGFRPLYLKDDTSRRWALAPSRAWGIQWCQRRSEHNEADGMDDRAVAASPLPEPVGS